MGGRGKDFGEHHSEGGHASTSLTTEVPSIYPLNSSTHFTFLNTATNPVKHLISSPVDNNNQREIKTIWARCCCGAPRWFSPTP